LPKFSRTVSGIKNVLTALAVAINATNGTADSVAETGREFLDAHPSANERRKRAADAFASLP
jgi:hypothetical protein